MLNVQLLSSVLRWGFLFWYVYHTIDSSAADLQATLEGERYSTNFNKLHWSACCKEQIPYLACTPAAIKVRMEICREKHWDLTSSWPRNWPTGRLWSLHYNLSVLGHLWGSLHDAAHATGTCSQKTVWNTVLQVFVLAFHGMFGKLMKHLCIHT